MASQVQEAFLWGERLALQWKSSLLNKTCNLAHFTTTGSLSFSASRSHCQCSVRLWPCSSEAHMPSSAAESVAGASFLENHPVDERRKRSRGLLPRGVYTSSTHESTGSTNNTKFRGLILRRKEHRAKWARRMGPGFEKLTAVATVGLTLATKTRWKSRGDLESASTQLTGGGGGSVGSWWLAH